MMPNRENPLASEGPTDHPLVRVSYEQAISSPGRLIEPLRTTSTDELRKLLKFVKGAEKVHKLFSMCAGEDQVTLVFSQEARANLRNGTWYRPIDRATGLQYADARDHLGRIIEPAKTHPMNGASIRIEQALGVIVAIAHVISAMDIQRRLAAMDEKLDWLLDFLHADREGELRGVYLSVQKALANTESAGTYASLMASSHKLDELQGRFFESARARLLNINNPADIGPIQAAFTRQSTAERELRERLGLAIADLRRSELCVQINTFVHLALGDPGAIHVQRRALASAYAAICDLVVDKVGYIDRTLAQVLQQRASAVEALGNDYVLTTQGELVFALEGGIDGD